jgi:iron-sulfur cluster assembly protein
MISITEKAADHIKGQLNERGKGVGIRLGVKTTGCSGLAYVIELRTAKMMMIMYF